MKKTNIDKISKMIDKLPYGSAFSVSDFTSELNYEVVKKSLQRLEKDKKIRRVIRGIYDKPQFSKAINEFAVPYPIEIANAIARSYNWRISPSGNVALNQLSLSTQVPSNFSYISTGPYKKYNIGNIVIEFNHRSNKELIGMSENTLTLIQAIKTIGKENINNEIINKLKIHYKNKEKIQILKESKNATKWIFEIIKKICME